MPGPQSALLWFTRDLRVDDHPALHAAIASGRPLVACYIHDDTAGGPWAMGAASRWWLHFSLLSLQAALRDLGVTLVLRRGDSVEAILQLARETNAAELHVGQPNEPAARAALDTLTTALAAEGCTTHRHWTTLLFDPDRLRTKTGGLYSVFTPFSKACLAQGIHADLLPAPTTILAAPPPPSDHLDDWALLPTHPDWAGGMRETWIPGQAEAHRRLHDWSAAALHSYAADRNTPGIDGVSRLSPHLHWGEISPRTVWQLAAATPSKGAQSFLNELLWREFCAHLLWHHPSLPDQPLRPAFNAMQWRNDPAELHAWQHGRTGIPIVDAGMRQLWHIGWQHNRVRLITASFMVKHLLIDWRLGEAWFWDCLVDADLGSNSASWQWVAGSGADAAPYFRIFNPWLQGQKFDPQGAYVKRWLPELAGLDPEHIHAPWDAPPSVLQAAGIVLGTTYPHPIVDLLEGRNRALAAFAPVSDQMMQQRA